MSLSYPCSPGWHCYSVGAAGASLPVREGNRFISELFFPGFSLKGTLVSSIWDQGP